MNKKFKAVLKILLSVSLITFILFKVDRQVLVENIRLLDFRFVPLILLFLVLNYVVGAFRWKALLIHKGTEHIKVPYLINLYFVGAFFNNFMPTSVGGDVYKIVKLGKKIKNTSQAFSSTFMERFTGVLMLIFIAMFSTVNILGWRVLLLLVWLGLSFYIGIFFLKILGSKIEVFGKIYKALIVYKDDPKPIIFAFFTSIIVQLLAIFTQYFVFSGIGINLPLSYSLLIFPVITLTGFIVPSLNGIGVQDALYISMFSSVGVSSEQALSASILYHLFRLVVSLFGGLLLALGKDD